MMRPLNLLCAVAAVLGLAASNLSATDVVADKDADTATAEKDAPPPIKKVGPPNIRILQHVQGASLRRMYPYGLSSLLEHVAATTSMRIDTQPAFIESFADPIIFKHPFIYVNFSDRKDWTFSAEEKTNLKRYLERGGFIFVDAGINASFLRGHPMHGQHHSFADWDASPDLKKAFESVFPEKRFQRLGTDHNLFRTFYSGLPDASLLNDNVRDFVVNEKWPNGTYSAIGLKVNGRIAVLATPIIAMGWGKNHLGQWTTSIRFRIRETGPGLSESLAKAAYSETPYKTTREDGLKDIIYTQRAALPGWVQEPSGRWRVFRYHPGTENNEFAHHYYTRLGLNILVFALTQG